MSKRWASLLLLSFPSGLSLLVLTPARADFLITFTDGGQVTVHRYVEDGQSINVYTPQGTIRSRKDAVSSITEIGVSQSMAVPLETVSAVSAPAAEVSAPGPAESPKTTNSDKPPKPEGEHPTETASPASATVERLDGEYQEVQQEFNKLWEKHVQDMNSGASEEVLTENRNRLSQLSDEQHKLVQDARRAVPNNLPTWAQ